MGINIQKRTSTTNTTAAAGRKILYIVEHYTAGVTSRAGSAINTADWFANPAAQASADFIVDDETIVQFNPDPANRYCWAVGGGHYGNSGGRLYGVAKNANTISIEICSTNDTGKMTNANDSHYSFTDKVVNKALELTKYLMEKYGIDADHVIRHYDVNGKPCPGIKGWNAESGDESKWKAFKAKLTGQAVQPTPAKGMQASSLQNLSEAQVVAKVGPLFTADQKKSGILACVSLAQFILESGYGKTELAQNANNCFGMKEELSGNTWSGSTWDGKSIYTKETKEEYVPGAISEITANFRKYPCIEDSIGDHSAYLLGAMNGSQKRYAGLAGEKNYKKAAQLIKDGGYATDSKYVSKLCEIIERWNLTIYNFVGGDILPETAEPWYRVRKAWGDPASQVAACHVLENAIKFCNQNPGTFVFDEDGKVIYPEKKEETPFMVRVEIDDLNIRKGPGTDYAKVGKYTGKGAFTIMEVKSGKGSTAGWGLLKAYSDGRNGWISLDFATKLK